MTRLPIPELHNAYRFKVQKFAILFHTPMSRLLLTIIDYIMLQQVK